MRKLIWGIVALPAIVFVIVAIQQAVQDSSRRTARESVKNDLKQIMLALHNYHDRHQSFPPTFVIGPDGKRWHSWRSLLLSDLAPELVDRYHFDEPWDGPRNSKLHDLAPDVFQSELATPAATSTNYFAIVGRNTMWPAHQPLGFRDVFDGSSNTIMLMEDGRSDINWLSPNDMLTGQVFDAFDAAVAVDPKNTRIVAWVDGSVRNLSSNIERDLLMGLITPSYQGLTFKGNDWPDDLATNVRIKPFKPIRDEESFAATTVVPAFNSPRTREQNQVWSLALQLPWNRLKKINGGDIQLLPQPVEADLLNSALANHNAVSDDNVFHGVSDGTPQSDQRMLTRLRDTFPDVATQLQPFSNDERRIRLFSAISKHLPFDAVFDRFKQPLQFRCGDESVAVVGFGNDPTGKGSDGLVYEHQVEVLDDRGDRDFLIRLSTNGKQKDHIILSRGTDGDSLQTIWAGIQERIRVPNPKHSRWSLSLNETLWIPILDFSIAKRFQSLEKRFAQFGGEFDVETRIDFAVQQIRLRLDETGADFVGTAEVGVIGEFGEPEFDPLRIRRFVFDGPFFIALQEPDAEYPYFAAFIVNAELMEPFAG